jgi:hypothetical protein
LANLYYTKIASGLKPNIEAAQVELDKALSDEEQKKQNKEDAQELYKNTIGAYDTSVQKEQSAKILYYSI